ncbi:MAG: RDD family protein [Acidobacteria bacterium]|nr:RDD family protein [Acidobacteriota bacterium]MBI3663034.1 RDD family protein [Acidobacteriota bacterium]
MSLPDQNPESFGEQLTIETPEQTSLDFPLAGIGSRFLALAHDTAIQILTGFVLVIVGMLLFAGSLSFGGEFWTWTAALLILLFFVLYYGYFAFFEAIWNGQTPGKRKFHLRVIHESGRPISIAQAIARNLLRVVDQFPGFYGVGIITSLLNRQNKRLGDYVAGTVVILEKEFADLRPVWSAALAAPAGPALLDTARLSPEEWRLIESFLARRSHLDYNLRSQMASQIAEKIGLRLGVAPEDRPRAEAFIEAISQQRSGAAGFR